MGVSVMPSRPKRELLPYEESALNLYDSFDTPEWAIWVVLQRWPYLSLDFLEWLTGAESEGWT